jgi:hypothetical protein
LNGQAVYQFADNPTPLRCTGLRGNLLNSATLTSTFDAANRLIETERAGTTLEPIYNGVGDRVGQTTSVTTTYFALDVMGLEDGLLA